MSNCIPSVYSRVDSRLLPSSTVITPSAMLDKVVAVVSRLSSSSRLTDATRDGILCHSGRAPPFVVTHGPSQRHVVDHVEIDVAVQFNTADCRVSLPLVMPPMSLREFTYSAGENRGWRMDRLKVDAVLEGMALQELLQRQRHVGLRKHPHFMIACGRHHGLEADTRF